ncbi:protein Aatf [Phlebotomus argentipes]|uniref:protein Aatf n=1 Tax=Phlebotomus argentipes TaxID=94469 RepID=UPI002893204A|nr:protein Aatf [Phlebotomus argentipes]XP_059613985.1 protein Aatf [Phlebotomus argentipes]
MPKNIKSKSISDEISSLFTRKSLADSDSDGDEVNLAESVEIHEENQVGLINKQNAPLLEEISARYHGEPSSRDLDSDSAEEEELDEEEVDSEVEELDEEESEDETDQEVSSDEREEPRPEVKKTEEIKLISHTSKESDLKGYSVKNQLKMWEKLMEVRIRSQSLVTLSNRLPFPEIFKQCKEYSEEFSSLASEVEENLANTMNKLIETQNCLISKFPDTRDCLKRGLYSNDDQAETRKKPRLEFSSMSNCDAFRKLYRSTIEKWSEKINAKENPLDQIDKVLTRKNDLMRSSRIFRGNYDLFKDSYGEIDDESGKRISAEIYDDTDFYHEILSELIEAKSSQNLDHNTAENLQKKTRNSVKKVVDTKASKGRRIRYVVHKKMINFMAPNPHSSWSDEAKDELFSSIFGAGH